LDAAPGVSDYDQANLQSRTITQQQKVFPTSPASTATSQLAGTGQLVAGQPINVNGALGLNGGNNYTTAFTGTPPPTQLATTEIDQLGNGPGDNQRAREIGSKDFANTVVVNNGAIGIQAGTAPSYQGPSTLANASGIYPAADATRPSGNGASVFSSTRSDEFRFSTDSSRAAVPTSTNGAPKPENGRSYDSVDRAKLDELNARNRTAFELAGNSGTTNRLDYGVPITHAATDTPRIFTGNGYTRSFQENLTPNENQQQELGVNFGTVGGVQPVGGYQARGVQPPAPQPSTGIALPAGAATDLAWNSSVRNPTDVRSTNVTNSGIVEAPASGFANLFGRAAEGIAPFKDQVTGLNAADKAASLRAQALSQLKENGVASRQWEEDNGDLVPAHMAAQVGHVPDAETLKALPSVEMARTQVAALVQDGKLLSEMGRYDEAEAKLKQALKADPSSVTVPHYLDLVQAARYTNFARAELAAKKELLNVEKEWLAPTTDGLMQNGHYPDAGARPEFAAKGGLRPTQKADSDADSEPANISYDWTMPLDQVLDTYSKLIGRTALTVSGSTPAFGTSPITLKTASPLTRTEATQALETVLGMNGLTVVPVGDKFFKVVSEASAPSAAGVFATNSPGNLPHSGRLTTEIVQLKSGDPLKLVEALHGTSSDINSVTYIPSTGSLILRDTPEKVNRMLAAVKSLDGDASAAKPSALSPQPLALAPKPATNSPIPQPEILTVSNAFSTFSLNVSDVSFKLAEASLQKGALPDPATVRSEEFINAFDYRDPEAAPGAPIAFAWERAGYPFAHNRDLLRFAVKTAAQGRDTGRPLNLVILLDKSGSMERADRVAIIHEALRVLGAQLQPRDTLSIVLFSRTARLWADGVSGSQAASLADALDGVTPEGGTNLEDAMKLAYETALRHYLANGENRVVILTDGAANLGDVKPEDLQDKAKAERTQGIALDCFGVGWEDYNDNLLELLSRAGGGRYGFINAPEEAATEFAGQLARALRVAASDVKVQVEFNPDRVISYRQIGYAKDQLTKEQFRDNTVKAAQLGVKESGNALYTVELNPQGNGPICTVHVRYRTPGTSDYYEHAWDVPYTGASPSLDQAGPAIRLAASASAFSEWLAGSPYAGEVNPSQLLGYVRDLPELYGPDHRPAELVQMLQEATSIAGR
jgi:Mg-chelatase subunit ChlD/tetratricopeptide (TPR) repeat protein